MLGLNPSSRVYLRNSSSCGPFVHLVTAAVRAVPVHSTTAVQPATHCCSHQAVQECHEEAAHQFSKCLEASSHYPEAQEDSPGHEPSVLAQLLCPSRGRWPVQ
jgi:hypothetical protein